MGIEFSSGIDNTLKLSPSKNKCTFDLNLRRYRASKFQNPQLHLNYTNYTFLADTSSVKFVYT